MDLSRTLRLLIVVEVLLVLYGTALGFFDESLLPVALQNYLRARADAPLPWHGWLLFLLELPILPLSIVAWVGLWRGWRNARLLYTLSWVTTPLLIFGQPWVTSGLGQFVNVAGDLVSGMIFGLLYFSELRHDYGRGEGS